MSSNFSGKPQTARIDAATTAIPATGYVKVLSNAIKGQYLHVVNDVAKRLALNWTYNYDAQGTGSASGATGVPPSGTVDLYVKASAQIYIADVSRLSNIYVRHDEGGADVSSGVVCLSIG
jgi:hypothetical protein